MDYTISRNRYYEGIQGSQVLKGRDSYFYVKMLETGNIFVFLSKELKSAVRSLEYSLNEGLSWIPISQERTIIKDVIKGKRCLFRGDADTYYINVPDYEYIDMVEIFSFKKHIIGGNILSLFYKDDFINYDNFPASNACQAMFVHSTGLISAENLILPSKVTNSCYSYMFAECSSLLKAPKLPAEQLENNCYGCMFVECSSLKKAPLLLSTKLARGCYSRMFYGCINLSEFQDELPAMELANACYYMMFKNCISLKKAPSLPAPILLSTCYRDMFERNSDVDTTKDKIESIEILAMDWLDNSDSCYNMFGGYGGYRIPNLTVTLAEGTEPKVVQFGNDYTFIYKNTNYQERRIIATFNLKEDSKQMINPETQDYCKTIQVNKQWTICKNKRLSNTEFDNINNLPLNTDITVKYQLENDTVLPKDMFKDCENLISVIIPDNILLIEEGAFDNCTNLQSIEVSRQTNIECQINNNVIVNYR